MAKTPAFIVKSKLTVPDIELGEFKGDFEPDGDVDGLDLKVFSDAYAAAAPAADLDGSGVVDTGDLAVFAADSGGIDCTVSP